GWLTPKEVPSSIARLENERTGRPAKFEVGRVHLRPIRGPHKDGSGRWYWQAEVYENGDTQTVWAGWATPGEARSNIEASEAAPVPPEWLMTPEDHERMRR